MRMADADGKKAFTHKQLAREELLEKQHLKLAARRRIEFFMVSGRYQRHENWSRS